MPLQRKMKQLQCRQDPEFNLALQHSLVIEQGRTDGA